ncbi:PD-(D/E)XK nuclease family protein [Patescibacteria group bacterium]|nr:PD-(D/E)XK nuclease family protein [Patescibacteria group bacterium]
MNVVDNLNIKSCPYCDSKNIIRRGIRKNKLQTVQLYICKDCNKTFTPYPIKNKKYPLKIILEGLTLYNLGNSKEKTIKLLKEKFGINISSKTLSNWIEELKYLCTYSRHRQQGKKLYTPNQIIKKLNLNHKQVYEYCYHQAKLDLITKDFPSNKSFKIFKEFLETIYQSCPHHYFHQENSRASQTKKLKFSLEQVMVKEKQNYATRTANLVLQSVKNNRLRHEILQRFMLANDSVTVAVEIPIYLLRKDIEYMEKVLKFEFPIKPEILTGHIDFIQFRNNQIHILDFKPKSKKDKPYEQLTWYAIALSRLTGLRLYDFKCAWFDQDHYYEFYPLHMVYKLKP